MNKKKPLPGQKKLKSLRKKLSLEDLKNVKGGTKIPIIFART